MGEIKIEIDVIKVGDPEISVYSATIRDERKEKAAIWPETLGSKELLEAFLTGVKAAFSFTEIGYINIPPIPEK